MTSLLAFGPYIGSALVVVALAAALVRVSGMVRYIGNSRVAVVEKLWSSKGSIRGGLIALKGEAGFQPDVLRGGLHARYQLTRQVAERFAQALETSGVDVVPKVSIGGAGGGEAGGSVIQGLLTLLMAEKLDLSVDAEARPKAEVD